MSKDKALNILLELSAMTGVMFGYRMITTKSINVGISIDFIILTATLTAAAILGKKLAKKYIIFKNGEVNGLTFNLGIVLIGAIIGVVLESSFTMEAMFSANGIVACIASLILAIGINMKEIENASK
ncbi:MAG: hypothetical protein ACRC2K_09090 [Clostridium sp.]